MGVLKRPGVWTTRTGLSGRKTMSTHEPHTHESTEPEPTADRTRAPVAGGVLVYESHPDGIGRELVGFEDVTDWAAVRSALQVRGHGVGAAHHLPVLDDSR